MKKHFVIREHLNGTKEQVFEGTLEEALKLQEVWGVDEIITIDNFDELMDRGYFGDGSDGFKYEEVTEKEYSEI